MSELPKQQLAQQRNFLKRRLMGTITSRQCNQLLRDGVLTEGEYALISELDDIIKKLMVCWDASSLAVGLVPKAVKAASKKTRQS